MTALLMLLASLLLAGCATPHSTQTLTPLNNGQEISVTVGQVLIVELPSNHTTGYSWSERTSPNPVLEQDGPTLYQEAGSGSTRVGAGGTEIWRFHAAKVGRQTLRLEYVRPWEKNVTPAKVVSFDVVVKAK